MLNDFTGAAHIYIACGYTDLRRGIDGLAGIVEQEFHLDPFSDSLFLFCGRRKDRIKALYWEGNGFVLLYKRLEQGSFQWPPLTNYLLDGRLEISNNRAERSVKPFVIGRKNFLFANTPGGARASAMIYSIIETAKANSLDPYRYLLFLLEEFPNADRRLEHWIVPFLPWNAPDNCRMRHE